MAEKKKTFLEQLDDPAFKALGGLDFLSIDLSPSKTFEKIKKAKEEEKEKTKNEELIEKLPKGSKGWTEATDKTIIAEAEDNNEVSLSESVSNAIISGGIKIPYGWAQLTAEIMDRLTVL